MPVGLLLLIPILALPQEPPPAKKQTANDQSPKPRLDLYGDPLPEWAIARMGTVRLMSTKGINSIAYSPDGGVIASAGHSDTAIHLWDARTGRKIAVLDGHEEGVSQTPPGTK